MSQADYIVSNGTGASVRSDLNGQLAAIVSNNSGSTEPATMYAYQWWADTTTGLLKLRNSANNAWITIRQLDGEFSTVPVENGSAAAPSIFFKDSGTDTGFFSPGADQVAISTGGTSRLAVSTTAVSSTLAVDVPLGAVGTPSLTFTGDLNTGAFSPAADTLALVTAGTNRLHITSGGLVGIGTTSPATTLHLASSVCNIRLEDTDTNAYANVGVSNNGTLYLQADGANAQASSAIIAEVDGSEKVRIDSSGRLLVGTSSARGLGYYGTPQVQIEGLDYQKSFLSIYNNDADDNIGGLLALGRSRGTALGSNTAVQDGNNLGTVVFYGSDGSEEQRGAEISAFVDGTPGAGDMPGRLVFSTTADGASSPTERMRLDSVGRMFIGSTSTSGDGACIEKVSAGGRIYISRNNNDSVAEFYRSGTRVGQINVDTTSTSYVTSSDYRLKENVTVIANSITRIQQLKPSRFNFIADPDRTVDGFIAHEAQAVVPECVTGEKDAIDDEGNPVYQGIDQSKLVPLLTAALQEAIAKIENLEARLTAAGID